MSLFRANAGKKKEREVVFFFFALLSDCVVFWPAAVETSSGRPCLYAFLSSSLSPSPLVFYALSNSLFPRLLTLQSLADDALALVLAALLSLERLAVQVLPAEAGIAAQHFEKGETKHLSSFSLSLGCLCSRR